MSDDELDRHLRVIRTALYYDARDRLRQAIDAAVRAERKACAKVCSDEADMRRAREQTFMRDGAEFDGRIQWHKSVTAAALAAAILNRSE